VTATVVGPASSAAARRHGALPVTGVPLGAPMLNRPLSDRSRKREKNERKRKAMATGTVKFFNTDRGFGFITPATGAKDVFVHYSNLVDNRNGDLKEGQSVEFDLAQGRKGPEAQNVRAL
jgi:cold shock protein